MQHGKDFEAITRLIDKRKKHRKDIGEPKTIQQVRHMYYRTWTAVQKKVVCKLATFSFVFVWTYTVESDVSDFFDSTASIFSDLARG